VQVAQRPAAAQQDRHADQGAGLAAAAAPPWLPTAAQRPSCASSRGARAPTQASADDSGSGPSGGSSSSSGGGGGESAGSGGGAGGEQPGAVSLPARRSEPHGARALHHHPRQQPWPGRPPCPDAPRPRCRADRAGAQVPRRRLHLCAGRLPQDPHHGRSGHRGAQRRGADGSRWAPARGPGRAWAAAAAAEEPRAGDACGAERAPRRLQAGAVLSAWLCLPAPLLQGRCRGTCSYQWAWVSGLRAACVPRPAASPAAALRQGGRCGRPRR
jgi:hypothetical protein